MFVVLKALAIDRDREYEDPMANITYPDVDRLTFWGAPYQFDYVFGPGTKQAQARGVTSTPLRCVLFLVTEYPCARMYAAVYPTHLSFTDRNSTIDTSIESRHWVETDLGSSGFMSSKVKIKTQIDCRGLRQVFDEVQPMVASALEGYRVCVFAYGQTGSGKTYTMEGPKADRWAMGKCNSLVSFVSPKYCVLSPYSRMCIYRNETSLNV